MAELPFDCRKPLPATPLNVAGNSRVRSGSACARRAVPVTIRVGVIVAAGGHRTSLVTAARDVEHPRIPDGTETSRTGGRAAKAA